MAGGLGRDGAAARLAASVASYALGVPLADILDRRRGSAEAAFARQVAMYLCHVAFELSLARIALAFERDRSTVAHACHVIEDRRDAPSFDTWIAALELMLRDAPAPSGARRAGALL
ncbi:MAG: helix-turn-helix domain-containing protein [Hyphomonadaceae bacterium]